METSEILAVSIVRSCKMVLPQGCAYFSKQDNRDDLTAPIIHSRKEVVKGALSFLGVRIGTPCGYIHFLEVCGLNVLTMTVLSTDNEQVVNYIKMLLAQTSY